MFHCSATVGRKVGGKIRLQRRRRAVVLCVVDVADFDGSLPRARAAGTVTAPKPVASQAHDGLIQQWRGCVVWVHGLSMSMPSAARSSCACCRLRKDFQSAA